MPITSPSRSIKGTSPMRSLHQSSCRGGLTVSLWARSGKVSSIASIDEVTEGAPQLLRLGYPPAGGQRGFCLEGPLPGVDGTIEGAHAHPALDAGAVGEPAHALSALNACHFLKRATKIKLVSTP